MRPKYELKKLVIIMCFQTLMCVVVLNYAVVKVRFNSGRTTDFSMGEKREKTVSNFDIVLMENWMFNIVDDLGHHVGLYRFVLCHRADLVRRVPDVVFHVHAFGAPHRPRALFARPFVGPSPFVVLLHVRRSEGVLKCKMWMLDNIQEFRNLISKLGTGEN